ncbi:MAG: after-VIT domain-containing protein, partial [Sphaerospermopsis sp. SIO1G2]|nr:after-VIT domain-containing protein [Sphaerospermopsis sp. SIO1G2]
APIARDESISQRNQDFYQAEESLSDDNEEFADLASLTARSAPSPELSETLQALPYLYVVSVKGLNQKMGEKITQYLQSIQLPNDVNGELVFEFEYNHSRVKNLVIDEQKSTLKNQKVIDLIKRRLLSWRSSEKIITQVILKLKIA